MPTARTYLSDAVAGGLLIATLVLWAGYEWTDGVWLSRGAMVTSLLALGFFARHAAPQGRIFLIVGAALSVAALIALPDGAAAIARALASAAFVMAFFTALTSLRSVAMTSAPIVECGAFLSAQPPGRRYIALSVGGALFGIILIYGSIALLGSLAAQSARAEPNPEIREIRLRRMLVAVQRGFVATLPWSPLTFAMAISTALVPGATWSGAVLPCAVSAVVLAGMGWALDQIFKPRLSAPAPARALPEGRWLKKLGPLLGLLVLLTVLSYGLHVFSGVRIVGVVMVVVPILALVWMAEQDVHENRKGILAHVAHRAWDYATDELPHLRTEIVLLAMAGFIGTLGAALAAPVVAQMGLDLGRVAPPLLLLGVFWILPLTGQIGMNPILAASLLLPLLPTPAAMGVAPAAVIVAVTSGWALSGATSPFTASTLLVADFGGVSARRVGLRWNGIYALCCGVILSGWILLAAAIL